MPNQTHISKYKFRVIIASCIFTFIYLYSTPYISILLFKAAIDNNNLAKAEKYINFKSLRSSLKPQLEKAILYRFDSNVKTNKYKKISILLLKPIINKLADPILSALITPDGLNLLLTKGIINGPKSRYKKKVNMANNHEQDSLIRINKLNRGIGLSYKSINIFVLNSYIDNYNEPIRAYWNRVGVINWRLSKIKIPTKILLDLPKN